jgi:hypothetical protein
MAEKTPILEIYRRNLPPWRFAGAICWVTWRLPPKPAHLAPKERDVVLSALRHFGEKPNNLLALVLMPHHVQVFISLYAGFAVQATVHSWQSFAAPRLPRECGRIGRVWQDEYDDRIIREEAEFLERGSYHLHNPGKGGGNGAEYPGVWVKGFAAAGTEARPISTEAPRIEMAHRE